MYKKFYGLIEKPFRIAPNPNFLYLSHKHENALTYLEYGLMERVGFIMLTGEIGTGKTTLIRYLLDQMESDMDVAVIFNTNVSSDQIIGLILQEFNLSPQKGDKAGSIEILYNFLIENFAKGKQALLIIDEAQNLSTEALEEIRMLSNLQSDEEILLQIMIVGQPELRKKLKNSNLAQFSQRIAVSYHLSPLTKEEISLYIKHRLKKAGSEKEIFTSEAIDMIYRASGGIPRSINLLCDAALVYGFADELDHLGLETINQVIADKGGMGLITEVIDSPDLITNSSETATDSLKAGLRSLDDRMLRLEAVFGEKIKEFSTKEARLTEIIVGKIKELLKEEQDKNEKLLIAYGKLEEKYNSLEKKHASGKF